LVLLAAAVPGNVLFAAADGCLRPAWAGAMLSSSESDKLWPWVLRDAAGLLLLSPVSAAGLGACACCLSCSNDLSSRPHLTPEPALVLTAATVEVVLAPDTTTAAGDAALVAAAALDSVAVSGSGAAGCLLLLLALPGLAAAGVDTLLDRLLLLVVVVLNKAARASSSDRSGSCLMLMLLLLGLAAGLDGLPVPNSSARASSAPFLSTTLGLPAARAGCLLPAARCDNSPELCIGQGCSTMCSTNAEGQTLLYVCTCTAVV
jgi:hypothetical protein